MHQIGGPNFKALIIRPSDRDVPFDQFALSALILVLVGGGMRLFYGAWPWEVHKTWYRTRQAVDFVEALRNEKKHKSALALTEVR